MDAKVLPVKVVIPAKAGIHAAVKCPTSINVAKDNNRTLDSRFRGNDMLIEVFG